MDLGSGIRKKPIPDPGVKKAPDPDPQHWWNGQATVCDKGFLYMLYIPVSLRWIPLAGQGIVYATNTGLLKILR
jgi:hypothetical protein